MFSNKNLSKWTLVYRPHALSDMLLNFTYANLRLYGIFRTESNAIKTIETVRAKLRIRMEGDSSRSAFFLAYTTLRACFYIHMLRSSHPWGIHFIPYLFGSLDRLIHQDVKINNWDVVRNV
jgi:hypothetical protein